MSGFRVVPLEAWHLRAVRLQPEQAVLQPMLDDAYIRNLARNSHGFTALDGPEVIACAGVILAWPGRECAWAMLSRCGPARFLRVHRAVAGFLAARETRRIEITVDVRHAAARRWALLLGFEEEGVLRAFTPDGRDVYSYGRLRNG